MTNMKHKSIAERSSRRKRYISAIEPLRDLYKCTAAQVYGFVMGDLKNLQKQVEKEKSRVQELEEKAISILNEKHDAIRERDVAIRANETSSNQVLNLQEQLEALEQRLQRQDRQIELLTEENKELAIRCGESS